MLSFNTSGALIAFNTNSGTSLTKSTRDTIREEAREYKEKVYAYFNRVDEITGRLIELAGKDAMVWVASDHGFGPAHKYCSFNIWLLQEGFLKLKSDALTRLKKMMFSLGITPEAAFKLIKKLPGSLRPARGASNQPGTSKLLSTFFLSFNDVDWTRTQAFSKGNYGQIYVNLKGREPNGVVSRAGIRRGVRANSRTAQSFERPADK